MKLNQKIIIAIAFVCIAGLAKAQVVEDTITVDGICEMCQKRIEEAAFGKGVKYVHWTNTNSQLVVVYKSNKVTLEEIEQRIAKAGHSTEHVKVKQEDYNKLPECCRYEQLEKH